MTDLTLLACLVVVCLPSSSLHLNICACHGIVLEETCPCEAAPPAVDDADAGGQLEESGCCKGCDATVPPPPDEAPADDQASHSDDEACHESSPTCPKRCCSELSVEPPLLAKSGCHQEAPGDGFSFGPTHGDWVRWEATPRTGLSRSCADGPPDWPRIRRLMLERAGIVLLI